MNFIKKIWYGKIRKSTYNLYAIIKNKEVIEIIYWNDALGELPMKADCSKVLVVPSLTLKVGSRWDGRAWIHP
jgi:hypothetical protein